MTSFEESTLILTKLFLLFSALLALSLIGKDLLHHYQFTRHDIPDHEERVTTLEEMCVATSLGKGLPLSSTMRQANTGGAGLNKEFPPVLKEYIQNDQVY